MNTKVVKDQATVMEEIRELISSGHSVTILAKGYSMNPFIIHNRDSVVLSPWTDSDIRKGRIALVRMPGGRYVLHRIVHRDGNRLVLMGDGNLKGTEQAYAENVIGLMTALTRNGKTYSCDSLKWRAGSWIWERLRPVRRWPLGLWRRLVRQEPLG